MARIVWRQFGLAVALVVTYALVMSYHSYAAHPHFAERAGGLLPALLLSIPRYVLFALPFAVGVSLALLPMRAGAFRLAALVVGVVTAALVLNDLVGGTFWREVDDRAMGLTEADRMPPRFDDTTSTLGGAFAHLRGKVQPQDIQPWPPRPSSDTTMFRPIRDPETIIRTSAAIKYGNALEFLVPLLVAGVVAGLGVWLHRIATFRTSRDEQVLRLVLGWLVTIAVVVGLNSRMTGSLYTLSSPRASMAWILVPYVIAAVPAFLGWRAVWRLDRLAGE